MLYLPHRNHPLPYLFTLTCPGDRMRLKRHSVSCPGDRQGVSLTLCHGSVCQEVYHSCAGIRPHGDNGISVPQGHRNFGVV